MSFWSLTVLSAGIGLIATIAISILNDVLLKHGLSVIHPEQLFANMLKIEHPVSAAREGMLGLFIASWMTSFGYLVLWLTPLYQTFSYGSPWIAAFTYSFCAWLVLCVLVLPAMHKGFFGAKHHDDTSYSIALLLIAYAIVLVACTYALA